MSVINTQIPNTHSRLNGVISSKEEIQNEILKLLKSESYTPTELQLHFKHKDRSRFSRDYLYPLRDLGKIIKVEGTNYFKLATQKATYHTIKKSLNKRPEIYKTDSFERWIAKKKNKCADINTKKFASICLGISDPKFKIHPDNITRENWKPIITNMVDVLLANYTNPEFGEPPYNVRMAIRGFIQESLEVNISQVEAENLRISGRKPKSHLGDLHITPEQRELAETLLKKRNVDPKWLLKYIVKLWIFVRPSTMYIIKLDDMEFLDQVIEYVEGADGNKITNEQVIQYAKARGDTVYSYTRRICHLKVKEHKTDTDFNKYILNSEFVEILEKYHRIRTSQRKRYLFWDNNDTEFEFLTYDKIVNQEVNKDNTFFKAILFQIGFKKGDLGKKDRANYAFRHFGLQMWLIDTDYNYELVSEMSHDDVATLKKWYGKRTQSDFQKRIRGIGI